MGGELARVIESDERPTGLFDRLIGTLCITAAFYIRAKLSDQRAKKAHLNDQVWQKYHPFSANSICTKNC